MTTTLVPPLQKEVNPSEMDTARAFAAVALAAVSWDGVLTPAGSRSLRHALDYREPYRSMGVRPTAELLDSLAPDLRRLGPQRLMVEAGQALTPHQRRVAFAVAAEIMRSDAPLEADEHNILASLASVLGIPEEETKSVLAVMDLLHANLCAAPTD